MQLESLLVSTDTEYSMVINKIKKIECFACLAMKMLLLLLRKEEANPWKLVLLLIFFGHMLKLAFAKNNAGCLQLPCWVLNKRIFINNSFQFW